MYKIFSKAQGVPHTDVAFDLLHVAVHELTMIVKKKSLTLVFGTGNETDY